MLIIHDMQPRHVHSLDLNLLVALDALLYERSVTRAGKRLGLTQSAMSRTLGRLRSHFGDPLLVRAGRQSLPTPRAEALELPLREALLGLDSVLAESPDFVPATARRNFTIAPLSRLMIFSATARPKSAMSIHLSRQATRQPSAAIIVVGL